MPRPRPWAEWELAAIREGIAQGLTRAQLSRKVGRTRGAVKYVLERIGQRAHSARQYRESASISHKDPVRVWAPGSPHPCRGCEHYPPWVQTVGSDGSLGGMNKRQCTDCLARVQYCAFHS